MPEAGRPLISVDAPDAGSTPFQRAFYRQMSLKVYDERCRSFIAAQGPGGGLDAQVDGRGIDGLILGADSDLRQGNFFVEMAIQEAVEIDRVEFERDQPVWHGIDDEPAKSASPSPPAGPAA